MVFLVFCIVALVLVVLICWKKSSPQKKAVPVYHDAHLKEFTELKGPVYEDIIPDPNTQSNAAYGHLPL